MAVSGGPPHTVIVAKVDKHYKGGANIFLLCDYYRVGGPPNGGIILQLVSCADTLRSAVARHAINL